MMLRSRAGLAGAALAAALWSCGGGTHAIEKDIASIREQLEQGKFEEAWEALSKDQRESISAADLAMALEADPEGVAALVALLGEAVENPTVEYRARLVLDDGTEILLLLGDGGWTIETPVTTFYGQTTPGEALASFVEAYEAKRWDVLARLMPPQYQTGDDAAILEKDWSESPGKETMDRIVKVLEAHLGDEIVVQGNQASLMYPDGHATLVREAGLWTILDLE